MAQVRLPAANPAEVTCAKVTTTALMGVRLNRKVGGCLRTGDTIRVSGRLTLSEDGWLRRPERRKRRPRGRANRVS